MMMKTIQEVRAAFWEAHPGFGRERRVKKRQNEYRADIRAAFVNYVDYLNRKGDISDALASRVTL